MPLFQLGQLTFKLIAAAAVAAFLPLPLLAATNYSSQSVNELRAQQAQLERIAQEKAAQAAEEADVAAAARKRLNDLNSSIAATQAQINSTQGNISETESGIADLNRQIKEREAEIERKLNHIETTLKTYFKMQLTRENIGYVGIAFSQEGISERIREMQGYEAVKRELLRQRDQLAQEKVALEGDKSSLEGKKQALSDYLTQQEIARQSLANQQTQATALKQNAEVAYAQLKKEEKAYISEQARIEAIIVAKIQSQLGGLRASGKGTPVAQGQVVGHMGSTGFSTGPHVHFTVFTPEGATVNPRTRLGSVYIWPVNNFVVSQEYGPAGWRNPVYTFHNGIDLAGPAGQPVYASADGKIILDEYYGGYGNAVVIEHYDGWLTLYGHMTGS